ncbi:MAG: tetratricopeptide repeat protein [Candidatus Caldatribacteriaceae bacterium]
MKRLVFFVAFGLTLLCAAASWGDGEVPPLSTYSIDVPAEGYAQVMFDQGYNLYQAGRKEEAIQFFVEAVTTKPNFAKAWTWLARTYQEEGMYDEAIWAWEKVVQLEPENTQAQYFLKKVKNWKQYGKDAWENYEKGIVALEKGEPYDAIEYFRKAIEANSKFDKAYYWLGIASLRTSDYHNAVWALEKYVVLRPDDSLGQYWLKQARLHLSGKK